MALIYPCRCGVPPIIVDPGSSCDDCLKIYSIRIPCDTGPIPGGGEDGTVVIDLSEYNDITACGEGGGTYILFSWDEDFFDSVDVTDEGIVTLVTSSSFDSRVESEVEIRFSCSDTNLSGFGSIFVCKKDLCAGVTCPEGQTCNQLTGECEIIG